MKKMMFALFVLINSVFVVSAQSDTLSVTLENVPYPYPVKFLPLKIEDQDLRMAYMDIKPVVKANGRTVILFHGKNFGGYYWTSVIKALIGKGFRIVVPDQIGFGKSSKAFIHYSFHQLATNNKNLLDTLGIEKVTVMGHSMGGMLATRFALMYPDKVEKLVLENPIGLEDYRTFVPYMTAEEEYQKELKTTAESVKKYYQNSYFPEWKPAYDYLVEIGAGVTGSADFPRYAKVAALTYMMIYEQPVCYEFSQLKVPVILFIGKEDRTIVGKGFISDSEKAKHGQYQVLGKETAKKIPNCKLIEFDNVGHIPHIQIEATFLKSFLETI
ncbi:alpha/beta hydrolase [Xanthocytophaga agilis]|uniref:Alpha/beta hydrolase n=1 Tax=Xanthocytophaga agilis TaxID=3048010 RepID=A0AAE3R099_9BACT|nr:alpha/beta hydrolase [Xanthocytophaga agilis]MDJ1499324.1 alpha/beta hydrolase [Xanthocytophaga agilis]